MVLKTSDDTADASAAKWTLPREQAASTDVRCPNCGATHPNPNLADTYRHCHSCAKVLRESSVCVLPHLQRNQSRRAFEGQNRLAVIAASFGHASDSKRAIAVLAEVQALVAHSTTHSRLHLPAGTPLMSSYFSKYADPAPGERKVSPGVLIERAEYGWLPKDLDMKLTEVHAKAKLSTCSDDLSKWQALRNANSSPCHLHKAQVPGSELKIGTDENLNALFGDPCPGLSRFLVVEYSLLGYGETGSDDEIIKKGGGQSRNFAMCKGGKLRLHVTAEGFLVKPMCFPLAAFGDPCRGIRKALTINYQVLGMGGTLVLRITDANRLAGGLVLGYPLDKVDGGVDGKMGFSERLAISTAQTTKPTARERMQSSASQRLWSSSK
ncbi:hypothetical protein DYB37_002766 [Aphanomyces astaci]|uniref:Uncharacterized protein n=1 Tax=Aphanomyces astaci TaxID=112090 RepID=A0A418F422_APHAT|nr:hypothetical protein DYB35_001999 [Aphanomyces astaci]RHZ23552.1 hypothetical protein DYB37_002766 [Aphanomyces astaci]